MILPHVLREKTALALGLPRCRREIRGVHDAGDLMVAVRGAYAPPGESRECVVLRAYAPCLHLDARGGDCETSRFLAQGSCKAQLLLWRHVI